MVVANLELARQQIPKCPSVGGDAKSPNIFTPHIFTPRGYAR
jgi:hypothetical protein